MELDVFLNYFIEICDKTKPSINKTDDLKTIYSLLEIPLEKNFSTHKIEDYLSDNIKELIIQEQKTDDSIRIIALHKLKQGLVYKGIIERDRRCYEYIDLITTLIGILGHDTKFVLKITNPLWCEVILHLKNYLVKSNSYCQLRKDSNIKEINIAKSALYLEELGCDIKIKDCAINIENKEKVIREINRNIKNIGGEKFLKYIYSKLLFVNEFDRFLIMKQGNQPLRTKIEIEIPYSFLLNLGLKYIDDKGKAGIDTKAEFDKIVEITKHFCFVQYPVQSYSIWENIFHKNKNTLEYFSDLIIKGSIYEIIQCQGKYAYEICMYILDRLDALEFVAKMNYSLSDYKKAINFIFSKTQTIENYTFFRNELIKGLSLNHKTIEFILDDLSQPAKNINLGYLDPTDYTNITFWEKPLIRNKSGKYILLPKSITSFAFYEALAGKLRTTKFKEIDTIIGLYIEDFLKEKLNEVGIKYLSGKYKDSELGEGEADIIIETSKSIILIECKKKSLTRKSKSGDYYSIILDLANSILDSQLQCLRTETILRRNGEINLNEESKDTTIRLDNRTIERVTFTFTDYGFLHDRIILDQILKELSKNKFSIEATEGVDSKDLLKMEKKIKSISENQDLLNVYIKELNDHNPFFNTWFLNLHHFLTLIERSKDNDSFYDAMKESKFVTMGSLDFYQEFFMKDLLTKYTRTHKKNYT